MKWPGLLKDSRIKFHASWQEFSNLASVWPAAQPITSVMLNGALILNWVSLVIQVPAFTVLCIFREFYSYDFHHLFQIMVLIFNEKYLLYYTTVLKWTNFSEIRIIFILENAF